MSSVWAARWGCAVGVGADVGTFVGPHGRQSRENAVLSARLHMAAQIGPPCEAHSSAPSRGSKPAGTIDSHRSSAVGVFVGVFVSLARAAPGRVSAAAVGSSRVLEPARAVAPPLGPPRLRPLRGGAAAPTLTR